jgi:methyl-accepting chemotaxis protein
MITLVYTLMQVMAYFRDNLILGLSGTTGLLSSVARFMGFNVIPLVLVFSLLIYLMALPIQKVQARLEAGEKVDPETVEKTRRRILRFSGFVLTINLIGFAVGFMIMLAVDGRLAEIVLPRRLIVLLSNLAGAYCYAAAQSALDDAAFAGVRDLLGIRARGERRAEASSTRQQILLTVALLLYGITVTQLNVSDLQMARSLGDAVEAKVLRGELDGAAAAAEFRSRVSKEASGFSSRVGLDPAALPLPWERETDLPTAEMLIFLMFALFVLPICAGIQVSVSENVRRRLAGLGKRIKDVVSGGGDLRLRLTMEKFDDIGDLAELVNGLLDLVQSMVGRIGSAADQTAKGAVSIQRVISEAESVAKRTGEAVQTLKADLESQATESRSLSEVLKAFRTAASGVGAATESQRSFVEDTSSAMEEMAANIDSVEKMTERAGVLSGELEKDGENGGRAVQETSVAIAGIEEASGKVLEVLGSLGKIAASTNLLAMNAAIEAAHAGDSGAGFAVVADEVRKLATDAATQTKSIREMIGVMNARVAQGVERSRTSGVALAALVKGIRDVAAITKEISFAMKEQAAGTRSVAGSLDQVVDSTLSIRERVGEQDRQADRMAESLDSALARLEGLAEASRRQADGVRTLEAAFDSVRGEVGRNAEAAKALEAEIARYKA